MGTKINGQVLLCGKDYKAIYLMGDQNNTEFSSMKE